ncbi:hypothetical protein SASPL_100988 [Salvia splendens]|uniref:Uncharacterized protein n=1 Tax=Salvia splendens TaxID=180675 RepID=A0A8X9ACZ9_SALSN|nr:hypothetical protein SASPL_100988 [Salvia splendens]
MQLAIVQCIYEDAASRTSAAAENSKSSLPNSVFDELLHYAALNASSTGCMSGDELDTVVTVLRRCTGPCNLLVFGLSHETLLWNSLNHNGRTVFVSDSADLVSKLEEKQSSDMFTIALFKILLSFSRRICFVAKFCCVIWA